MMTKNEGCHTSSPNSSLIQITNGSNANPIFPNLDTTPDPKLVSEGWERRFIAGPDRLEEVTNLYKELGFEILTEAVQASQFSSVCQECSTVACTEYITVYTRKLK